MLNISDNSVEHLIKGEDLYCTRRKEDLSLGSVLFRRWVFALFAVALVILFLPWRQNIQTTGELTTLSPAHRPQTIHSTIAGRIEKWYVNEGQLVEKGDTIVYISEIKTEYFDTGLVSRSLLQVSAKESTIQAYDSKAKALDELVQSMRQELAVKQVQLEGKIKQASFKLLSARADYEQAKVALNIARIQYQRADTLFRRGIESRNELENKQQKYQSSQADAIAAENKVNEFENELAVVKLELTNVSNEYNGKIAKALSDKYSTLSEMYNAEGDLNKMRIQYENYSRRSQFYYIIAPQDCYITKAVKPGLGETIKEGDAVVSIMPSHFTIAAELYINPVDLPLLSDSNIDVRLIFDGWPAFVFSGWPDQSVGTYEGKIVAIDNTINEKGKYRILVGPRPGARPWPSALRPGSGARGITLLNTVPVWYEIWRKLNGFPADYYKPAEGEDDEKGTPAVGKVPAKKLVK